MMRHLLDLFSRFRRDERGAFAVIFGLLAIVLVAMSGAVVDFTSMQQSRTRAQVALDAAALALQPRIYDTNVLNIQTSAQALLVDRLADPATNWADCSKTPNVIPCATVGLPTVDTVNGQLTLTATLKVPMNFVSLVGVNSLTAQIVSVATRKKLALEVAMVLDNSGSMGTSMGGGNTRMSVLQNSAKCASNILFYGVTTCSASTSGLTKNANTKLAVVPFTSAVNVRVDSSIDTASWIDRTGNGNVSDQNFDNDDDDSNTFSGPVDRIGLFSKIGLSWGGCVEARINNGGSEQYDTDDTTPDPSKPDTLFTPYFAPDEPGNPSSAGRSSSSNGDTFYNSYLYDSPHSCDQSIGCTWTETRYNCSSYTSCAGVTTGSGWYTKTIGTSTNPVNTYAVGTTTYAHPPSSCTCSSSSSTWLSDSGTNTYTGSGSSRTYTRVRTCNYTYSPTGLTNRELQERLCKYDPSNPPTYAPSQGYVYGPNGDCPFNPLTPLTDNPSTITAAVNAMAPQGATNIAEGAAWGFRVLSPTAPFTEGGPYNSTTSKVMIIMTDGENTRYTANNMNDAQYYSPYAYPVNPNRLGTATTNETTLQHRVNDRLSTICTNAKAAGITVYTIGLATNATNEPSTNTALLTNCASQASYAYFPTTSSDLQNAFTSIANQLAALRLSR